MDRHRNCVSAERFPQRSPSRGVSCPNYSNYADSTQPQPLDYQGPGEHCADDHGAAAPAGYWAAAAALTEERDDGYNMIGGFTRA